jgi:hypothetical protein
MFVRFIITIPFCGRDEHGNLVTARYFPSTCDPFDTELMERAGVMMSDFCGEDPHLVMLAFRDMARQWHREFLDRAGLRPAE